MFHNRLTELLGIEYPIIQGGLQWLSRAELASAVSNAGGLGIITAATFDSKEDLRQEIHKARNLTDKPFGLNITFITAKPEKIKEDIEIIMEEAIPVVEMAGRSPEAYLRPLKEAGVKVIHKAATVRHALSAEKYGADAVVIVGVECGGHPSMDEVTSMVLIPATVDALDVPVIAGGGICDARGFMAALSLGAEGVLLGTRFMLTQECSVHLNVKQWLLAAQEADTMLVGQGTPRMRRVMRNRAAEKTAELESREAPIEELLPLIGGGLSRKTFDEGDIDTGIVPCGQVVGLIHDIPNVQEVVHNMVHGARDIAGRLHNLSEV